MLSQALDGGTQQVFGRPEVFVLVDVRVEEYHQDEDAVVGNHRLQC